jgi:hypothetical protein
MMWQPDNAPRRSGMTALSSDSRAFGHSCTDTSKPFVRVVGAKTTPRRTSGGVGVDDVSMNGFHAARRLLYPASCPFVTPIDLIVGKCV